MKYIVLLLIGVFSSPIFGCACFKSKAQKERERVKERAEFLQEIKSRNNSEPEQYQIRLTNDEGKYWYSDMHYPESWPAIRRELPYFDRKAMEWKVTAEWDVANPSDTHNNIEVVGPHITSVTLQGADLTFSWYIKPLAKGTGRVRVCYISKDGTKIVDEKLIKVTVTD